MGISLARARELLSSFATGESETVPPTQAFGRQLWQDLRAAVSHPNARVSALDGVAVDEHAKAGDRVEVIGESRAGLPFAGALQRNQGVRVYTGAVLPSGAAAVLGVEHLKEECGGLRLRRGPDRGAVREVGEDFAEGELILQAGEMLGSSEVALAVAAGAHELRVARRMVVGLVSSGDEVVQAGSPLGAGQVYDSNRWGLLGRLRRCGAEVIDLGHLPDEAGAPEALAHAARALGCDLVISSGGVSMGKHDGLRDSMLSAEKVVFWKINMRPGGPVMLGHIENVPFLGLPGNPVSSLVAFDLLAAPALFGQEMQQIWSTAAEELRGTGDRDVYLRVHSEAAGVRPFSRQSSGVLRSLHEAPLLAHVPAGVTIKAGETVRLLAGLT